MNNNPITEVGMFFVASLLIIGGALLLYFGRIDFTAFALMFGSALALFGVNGALKAPSPAQQAQLNGQQQNLQYLLSQTLATLPGIVQSLQQPVVTQSQPQQMPIPVQVPQQAPTPARGPVASFSAMAQPPLQGQSSLPGQFLPAVNLGARETATAQTAFPQRSWNDSQIMPVVGPGQGQ